MQNIAIIGAGASGLICAIELAKKNFAVTIFEKNQKVGKKLLATGNGKCNISNKNISKNNYHSLNPHFIDYTLNNFTFETSKKFFETIGIEFYINEKNKAFPHSLSAASVVELLEYEVRNLNCNIILDYEVTEIVKQNNIFLIDNKKYDKVILANGSFAMPKLGGTQSGYSLASNFRHTIIEPFDSLVQLVCDDKNLDIINGLKINAKINNFQGDLLFTKYGLSGSMILDISRKISYNLQYENNIKVSIDTMPNFTKDKLSALLKKRLSIAKNKTIQMWLDGLIHIKLAKFIVKKLKFSTVYAKDLTKKDILKITFLLKNLPFSIVDTKGFEYCEVCAGGVDTTQINSKTFESNIVDNLYILGELLDIDGDCGGYNLHFAFGSGYLCAKNMKG